MIYLIPHFLMLEIMYLIILKKIYQVNRSLKKYCFHQTFPKFFHGMGIK